MLRGQGVLLLFACRPLWDKCTANLKIYSFVKGGLNDEPIY